MSAFTLHAGAAVSSRTPSFKAQSLRRRTTKPLVLKKTTQAIAVPDVVGPVQDTIEDLKTVEGLKKVGLRVAKYAPATVFAATVFGCFPSMDACMAACGLSGKDFAMGGPLAQLAQPLLFSQTGKYVGLLAGVAGMLGIGDDIPAYVHSAIVLIAVTSLWQYSTVGTASMLVVNAFAFHYALLSQLLLNCKEVMNRIPYNILSSIRKVALVGPGMLMAVMQLVPKAWEIASFEKAGFVPPGVLGPIGEMFLHPIVPWVILASSLLWLTDGEKNITSFILGVGYLVPGISYCWNAIAPYSYALMAMHLVLGLQLLKEITPVGSFIPNPL